MQFKASLLEAGSYLGGVTISKNALKEAVKNTDFPIPLSDSWDNEKVIGYISTLEYENGKIVGTVNLFKDLNMEDKAISSGFHKHLNYIVSCSVIDKIKPMEKENDT